jgi:threonine/homoserine/homoserine lactone efflux protein
MNILKIGAFTLAAAALLGSPGPGIAALVAVGRAKGVVGGLRFYTALQAGLAIAAAGSAVGLTSALAVVPAFRTVLIVAATVYLLWLAWSVASAPIGEGAIDAGETRAGTARGGFLLGVANPNAYIAFASLMGSFTLLQNTVANALLKWSICVVVMICVDLAWLWAGALVGAVRLRPTAERAMNVTMGAAIAAACVAAFL